MQRLIIGGLASGAITVLVCTSKICEPFRKRAALLHPYFRDLLVCHFCTSFWVSLAMLERFSIVEWAATVALANITVLLIHLAAATVEDTDASE